MDSTKGEDGKGGKLKSTFVQPITFWIELSKVKPIEASPYKSSPTTQIQGFATFVALIIQSFWVIDAELLSKSFA